MVSIRLPRIRGWGNLSGPYEAPSAYLPRIAWTSPLFPRPVQLDIPGKLQFLVRPRLLTRFSVLPMAHRRTGANIV